jgi:hypothetical protein
MAGVQQYKKRPEVREAKSSEWGKSLGGIGMVVGGVAGAIGGGPMGAIGGASQGASTGQMVGGFIDPAEEGYVSQEKNISNIGTEENAMARRMAKAKEDRLVTLKKAEAALQQLPKEIQQEYAPQIVSATMAEEKRRAMGGQ